MSEKLKDYQVLDVLYGGTFYKVKNKVTNNIFAWKAYNCSAYSYEQIQIVDKEVKTISKVLSGNLLRYYDTILHGPSKTLYFVLEYSSWQSVKELIAECKATDKYFNESFVWYLLLELARACKTIEGFRFIALQKCISVESIFVGENGDVRINCFDLQSMPTKAIDLIRLVGEVLKTLCYLTGSSNGMVKEFYYSDDLRDVVSFLTDDRNSNLRPDVVLYHPTVLTNADSLARPKHLNEILLQAQYSPSSSEVNKCDSEKAVELCKIIEPLPRSRINVVGSPIYCNISPKTNFNQDVEETISPQGVLSPTLAALALELPGYVPRSRKPFSEALDTFNSAQRVSEETFSQQWMSRLVALRQREESLNKRERELIAKEIVHSPSIKVIPCSDPQSNSVSNGITLPPVVSKAEEKTQWVSRRRRRRSSLHVRARRKSYAYEDLDSSLSADAGDGSIIVTATKITKDNMPRRNIFPDLSSKKIHVTSSNPFVESDESVTLTFYDLENGNNYAKQCQMTDGKELKDIAKFKYLDVDKVTSEKRTAKQWTHSPSKQAKIVGQIFADITNHGGLLRKTPSKASLTSRGSNTSKCSGISLKSQWNIETNGNVTEDNVSDRTRASFRQSVAHIPGVPAELKKTKSRRSLLPFKTPFKLRSVTTKV